MLGLFGLLSKKRLFLNLVVVLINYILREKVMLCQAILLSIFVGINGKHHTTWAIFVFINRKLINYTLNLTVRVILILTFYLVYCLVFVVLAFPLLHHRKVAGKPQVNKLRSESDLEAIDQFLRESTELENGLRNLDQNLTDVCFR